MTLSIIQIDRNEAIRKQWEKFIAIMEQLHREGKDVNVWQSRVNPIYRKAFKAWVIKQRKDYSAGTLSPERIARLEATGFKWVLNLHDAKWDECIAILEQSHLEGKDVNFEKIVINGIHIHTWGDSQRAGYKTGILSTEKIARLEAIGFKWTVR